MCIRDRGDTYRALALLTKYERDKEGFTALLWQLDQLCSAVLRRPAYGQEQCNGLTPDAAARILNADAHARKSLTGKMCIRDRFFKMRMSEMKGDTSSIKDEDILYKNSFFLDASKRFDNSSPEFVELINGTIGMRKSKNFVRS